MVSKNPTRVAPGPTAANAKCLALLRQCGPHFVGSYEGLAPRSSTCRTTTHGTNSPPVLRAPAPTETLSPDLCLSPFQTDYKWLARAQVSEATQRTNNKLLWHTLGAKIVSVNANVHLESVTTSRRWCSCRCAVLTDINPGKRARSRGR